ncbi:hypothetical protein D3C87_1555570 [compost metagenome]
MLSLLLASTIAQAALTMECKIVETTDAKAKTTVVNHVINQEASHSMTPFDTGLVHGFVAISRGYGVINLINNKNEQVVSFHGDVTHGGIVGGKIYFQDSKTWVEADCQIVK